MADLGGPAAIAGAFVGCQRDLFARDENP